MGWVSARSEKLNGPDPVYTIGLTERLRGKETVHEQSGVSELIGIDCLAQLTNQLHSMMAFTQ